MSKPSPDEALTLEESEWMSKLLQNKPMMGAIGKLMRRQAKDKGDVMKSSALGGRPPLDIAIAAAEMRAAEEFEAILTHRFNELRYKERQ